MFVKSIEVEIIYTVSLQFQIYHMWPFDIAGGLYATYFESIWYAIFFRTHMRQINIVGGDNELLCKSWIIRLFGSKVMSIRETWYLIFISFAIDSVTKTFLQWCSCSRWLIRLRRIWNENVIWFVQLQEENFPSTFQCPNYILLLKWTEH